MITPNNYFGIVAKCQHGKLGVIYNVLIPRELGKPNIYIGVAFDGKKWESIDPIFVADNIFDYIHSSIMPIV